MPRVGFGHGVMPVPAVGGPYEVDLPVASASVSPIVVTPQTAGPIEVPLPLVTTSSSPLGLTPNVAGSGGGGGPNEPADFTKVTERSWSAFDEDGWTHGNENHYSLVSDATAPKSPSSIGQMNFPIDGSWLGGGTAPSITSRTFSPLTELYYYFGIKLSDPYDGHSSGVNKIIFGFGSDGDEKHYFNAEGNENKCTSGCAGAFFGFNIQAQGVYGGNLQLAPFKVGQWHEVEAILRHNTPGTADGEAHVWWNGTKTHEHFDVVYSLAGESGDWADIRWNPTYGGNGGELPEQEQQMWLDHLYLSGK